MVEKQVVSLELGKELKGAGYPQEGLWWWIMTNITTSGYDIIYKQNKEFQDYHAPYNLICSAPTCAELGEMLKEQPELPRYGNGGWIGKALRSVSNFSDTEANARAKMWLYLKKNNLLKEVD